MLVSRSTAGPAEDHELCRSSSDKSRTSQVPAGSLLFLNAVWVVLSTYGSNATQPCLISTKSVSALEAFKRYLFVTINDLLSRFPSFSCH